MQIKTNKMINIEGFIEFFQELFCFIEFENGNFVIVAETNFKSSIGIIILEKFSISKTEFIRSSNIPKGSEIELEENYSQDELKIRNLSIKTFTLGLKEIFYTKIGNYLFTSNNMTSLLEVLDAATEK